MIIQDFVTYVYVRLDIKVLIVKLKSIYAIRHHVKIQARVNQIHLELIFVIAYRNIRAPIVKFNFVYDYLL